MLAGSAQLNCDPPPLHIPDLSLVAEIPGAGAGLSRAGEFHEDETIEISADSNPYTTLHPDSASFDTPPDSMDTTPKQPSNESTSKTCNDAPSLLAAPIRTARIGLLERLLTNVYALFKMAKKSA